MPEIAHPPGRVTVSPGVLAAIAHMSAKGVAGVKAVVREAAVGPGLRGGRGAGGVTLAKDEGVITGDIFIVIKSGFNVREVCREVQTQVGRALEEMAGMPVARLDVHVQDVYYEGAEA